MANVDRVAVAILAKAAVPGFAKTRLIPALGAHGAAALQARLIERTVATACAANIGPVTLWGAPDTKAFAELGQKYPIRLARQPDGDLGERMRVAAEDCCPALMIGTDCPALEPAHLQDAAAALRDGTDVVIIPAEDGGYVLIGLQHPARALFENMPWGTASVMAETRRRAGDLGLALHELSALWDVDVPADLERLRATGLAGLLSGVGL